MFTLILNTANATYDDSTKTYSWTVNWGNIIDPFTSNKQKFLVTHTFTSDYIDFDYVNDTGQLVVSCNLQSFGYSPYQTNVSYSDTSVIRPNQFVTSLLQNPINVAIVDQPINVPDNLVLVKYKAEKSMFVCDNLQEISVVYIQFNFNNLFGELEKFSFNQSTGGTHKFVFTPL